MADDPAGQLGEAGRAVVARAMADMGPGPLVDYHVHILGLGTGGSGATLRAGAMSWRHPLQRIKTGIFLRACGVRDAACADEQYVARLAGLARGAGRPMRAYIMALDHLYRPDGTACPELTDFYTPNDYVARLAAQHADVFDPVVSIHPYRRDAVDELERWAAQGVRLVKWLPNAQGIDPSAPICRPFYAAMQRHGLILLTHAGAEASVASAAQSCGNPLLLRLPLESGLTVIVAHCAGLGRNEDLDSPGRSAANFDLFLRLMAEERYRGRLFADISAMAQFNRAPGPILELIRRPDLHDRLVHGSDYPLPAVNIVIWTRQLVWAGLITPAERRGLNELFAVNPLLFDLVLKRTLRDPRTGHQLPARLFQDHPALARPG